MKVYSNRSSIPLDANLNDDFNFEPVGYIRDLGEVHSFAEMYITDQQNGDVSGYDFVKGLRVEPSNVYDSQVPSSELVFMVYYIVDEINDEKAVFIIT